MELLLNNAEGHLSSRDKDYAVKKLSKLERFFNRAARAQVVHREEKSRHRIEITLHVDDLTVRGEEESTNVRAAIDRVVNTLENRIKRFKSRLIDRHRRRNSNVPLGLEEIPEEELNHTFEIKERKHFLLKDMSVEEAVLQLELIGHPFFVFKNRDNGQMEVLYKRKDGKYGLVQPEV